MQTKSLRAILRLTVRAKTSLVRLLTGTTRISAEVWKRRLGVLHGILSGNTFVRDFCILMLHCPVENSWTYRTVQKLMELLEDKLDPYMLLERSKTQFKEDVRNLIGGHEIRQLVAEVETSLVHRVPINPFQDVMPMLLTDFSYKSQRHARSFAALYCADFFRNYGNSCYLCADPALTQAEVNSTADNTAHLLSGSCRVASSPQVTSAREEVKSILRKILPESPIVSEVCSGEYWARWILNPTCVTLGKDKLTPEQLQLSGADTAIRLYAHKLIQSRYSLLKEAGLILRTRGESKSARSEL